MIRKNENQKAKWVNNKSKVRSLEKESPSQDVEVESESGYILGSLCLYISISLVAASFVGSGEEIY